MNKSTKMLLGLAILGAGAYYLSCMSGMRGAGGSVQPALSWKRGGRYNDATMDIAGLEKPGNYDNSNWNYQTGEWERDYAA